MVCLRSKITTTTFFLILAATVASGNGCQQAPQPAVDADPAAIPGDDGSAQAVTDGGADLAAGGDDGVVDGGLPLDSSGESEVAMADSGADTADPGTKTGDAVQDGQPDAELPVTDGSSSAGCTPGTACDDDEPCTLDDKCSPKGVCIGGPDDSCNDGAACTDDSCKAGYGCIHKNIGGACDDGDACTEKDTCAKGKCSGPAIGCEDGSPCTADLCDKIKGCVHMPTTGVCDDGNSCTQGDQCDAGKCIGGTNLCACQQDADCGAKEDGDLCNGTLYCDKSVQPFVCKVNPTTIVTCDTSKNSTCLNLTCVASSGKCTPTSPPDGTPCDADGSICTPKDTCAAGVCVASKPIDCDDKSVCTSDSCDPKAGCVFAQNTLPCDADGSACTEKDTCAGGKCVAGAALNCNDKNGCTTDSCDKVAGCQHTNNTLPCDADGSLCTDQDACAGGKCGAGPALKCEDNNGCTTDSCDPAKGCVFAQNTLPCDADGNACTQQDACAAGKCIAGNPKSCDDNNPCSVDVCDKGTAACSSTAATDGGVCNDGNACTASDACSSGQCVGVVKTCDDKNPCTGDACNPTNGCTTTQNQAPCDDGNVLTAPDVCSGGVCKGNNVPTISGAAIQPAPLKTGDTAQVAITGWSDKDGDLPGYVYAWYVGSKVVGTDATLPAMTATKGQAVFVKVWPNDGKVQGDPVVSPTLVVANTAPTAPVVEILPASPNEDTDLTCKITAPSTDADGDPVTYTFAWTEDGVAVPAAAGLQVILGTTVSAKKWQCTATASDGTASTPGTSASVQPCALLTWYLDADGDNYGLTSATKKACVASEGYVATGGDCNDSDGAISPKAVEKCDGIDNDCDGVLDPPDVDLDGDGLSYCKGDCNDANFFVHSNMPDICGNAVDDNCDGKTDVGDNDGDGYYGCGGTPVDCNDNTALSNAGVAQEYPGDGVDNNCDGGVDGTNTDDDADGFSEDQGDCDDSRPWINAKAFEIPGNGIDEDCNTIDDKVVNIASAVIFLDGKKGSDFFPGSQAFPVKTLDKALALAGTTKAVLAASGAYTTSAVLNTHVIGRYNSDWTWPGPATTINGNLSQGSCGGNVATIAGGGCVLAYVDVNGTFSTAKGIFLGGVITAAGVGYLWTGAGIIGAGAQVLWAGQPSSTTTSTAPANVVATGPLAVVQARIVGAVLSKTGSTGAPATKIAQFCFKNCVCYDDPDLWCPPPVLAKHQNNPVCPAQAACPYVRRGGPGGSPHGIELVRSSTVVMAYGAEFLGPRGGPGGTGGAGSTCDELVGSNCKSGGSAGGKGGTGGSAVTFNVGGLDLSGSLVLAAVGGVGGTGGKGGQPKCTDMAPGKGGYGGNAGQGSLVTQAGPPVLFQDNFEGSMANWTIDGGWQQLATPFATSGEKAVYYGKVQDPYYPWIYQSKGYTSSSGSITSVGISIPASGKYQLRFYLRPDFGGGTSPNLTATVSDGSKTSTIYSSAGGWMCLGVPYELVTFDLSAFSGKTVKIQFTFSCTCNHDCITTNNVGLGPYIDDVMVVRTDDAPAFKVRSSRIVLGSSAPGLVGDSGEVGAPCAGGQGCASNATNRAGKPGVASDTAFVLPMNSVASFLRVQATTAKTNVPLVVGFGSTVSRNVLHGLAIDAGANSLIASNTVLGRAGPIIPIKADGLQVVDNVLQGSAPDDKCVDASYGKVPKDLQNNVYWKCGGGLYVDGLGARKSAVEVDFISVPGTVGGSVDGDPKLGANFPHCPTVGSAALDVALNKIKSAMDVRGVQVPQGIGPDIGACEFKP
ncbi:MAG: putative metal-binding motif-containing protein [Deltaproteobacteria bacterium]|nr:putative metal-binding motif-containing protein [Deltaproteobacteria bacterium]